jgi:thermitase
MWLSAPILMVVGLIALAWGASKQTDKNAVLMLAGLALAIVAIPMHFMRGAGAYPSLISLLQHAGVGLLLGAGVIARRKGTARNLFLVGLMVLGISIVLRVPTWASHAFHRNAEVHRTVSVLVELGPDDNIGEIQSLIDEFGGTAERAFPSVGLAEDEDLAQVFLVSGIKKELLKKFLDLLRRQLDDVDYAELNDAVGISPPIFVETSASRNAGPFFANDPMAEQQWALSAAQINEAHDWLRNAKPVRKAIVAVLDTGVDARHEDIKGTFSSHSPATSDAHGHGTHCAGIAGAATNNGTGIASLNWNGNFVEVASYKALGDDGMGSLESIAQSIIDATTDGADVISMSLGQFTPVPSKIVVDAVEFALQRDVIIVAAAGNSNQDASMHMPSNIDGVISVAAVDQQLRKAAFSNINTKLNRPIAAPGVNILSLEPGGRYGQKSGTSMATPLVAGLIGVMRALNPNVTADQAYEILRDTGVDGQDVAKTGKVVQASHALSQVLPIVRSN